MVVRAVELGVRFFDTSDAYAGGRNEELLGRSLSGIRHRVLIATKFGWRLDREGRPQRLDSSPQWVRTACEASLRRLATDRIDLYLQHRVDPAVPIEETAGAVSRLIEEGKVGAFGLSEASPATIRRAHAVQRVAALQTEYSLWWREPELVLLPLCAELGAAYIAYSPLGRGLLNGQVGGQTTFSEGDLRRQHPRFAPGNLEHNLRLVSRLGEIAAAVGCSSGQLALAWLLSRPWPVVPIPGTRSIDHLEANLAAADLRLSPQILQSIEAVMPPGAGAGERHPESHRPTLDR